MYYYVDEGSMEEESEVQASHRCSMVKRYNMPTFFTPDKSGGAGRIDNYSTSPGPKREDINLIAPQTMYGGN